jgi:hypothetical protein
MEQKIGSKNIPTDRWSDNSIPQKLVWQHLPKEILFLGSPILWTLENSLVSLEK